MLVILLLVTFAAPAVSVTLAMPGEWYRALIKPALNPPAWVFGPVWTVLYTLMAIAAWLVWRAKTQVVKELVLYGSQLVLNAAWSPIFFGLHRLGTAMGVITLLWITIVVTMIHFFRARAAAGWLFVPYLLWVSFASYLNFALWQLNPA